MISADPMDLPADFVRNIRNAFPLQAEAWLAGLPDLLQQAAARWRLKIGEPFLLSYNYVCAATRADGTPAVLKIGVPNRELTSEINTLRVYAGQGACRLYEADPEKGMLLLERLLPGAMLVTLEDDDRATGIAADVLKQTHRPVPRETGFLSLRRWFGELKNVRTLFNGGSGPFPEKTFSMVEALIEQLFAEAGPEVLLHGDFHHYNILQSERGWLVIDPKGVAGPAEYDPGPLLTNPYTYMPEEPEAIRRTQRRIAILAERAGFEPQRLRAWGICHCVLSSYWDMQPDGTGGEEARQWAEILIKTKV
jgi:streptomycin 6-kinase